MRLQQSRRHPEASAVAWELESEPLFEEEIVGGGTRTTAAHARWSQGADTGFTGERSATLAIAENALATLGFVPRPRLALPACHAHDPLTADLLARYFAA